MNVQLYIARVFHKFLTTLKESLHDSKPEKKEKYFSMSKNWVWFTNMHQASDFGR